MTQTNIRPPGWQKGYRLEELRAIAEVFKASDKDFVLGAFTGFKERDVAAALAADRLRVWRTQEGKPLAAIAYRRVISSSGVADFTGELRDRMWAGDVAISRIGCLPGHEAEARSLLGRIAGMTSRRLFVQIWEESAQHHAILEGAPLQRVAVKIPASSELIGIYATAPGDSIGAGRPIEERDTWGLRRLDLEVDRGQHAAAVEALERVPTYAQHYSSYNKGRAWAALTLRGYSDDAAVIVKPAEMSKKWKAEHPEMLHEPVRDTELRRRLPELERLISRIPGPHQRIRLMRLEPGGGELTRHADITDPEAGTAPGKVLRIHLPLITNPDVRFSSWTLEGERYERNMAEREAWYLDTRKPHTAINGGESPRIHLVIDAFSSPELLTLLARGE